MLLRIAAVVGFVAGIAVGLTSAECPHKDKSLKKFSSLFNGYDKSSDLEVTEATLLDVGSLDINTITISGTGKLVFNQGLDITINTKGIRVIDDGALIIGSEECRHEDNVNIILEGERTVDRDSLGDDGEKFISVTDNGVLQIHGQDRLAWTKLNATVNRFASDPTKVKFMHSASPPSDFSYNRRALFVSVLDSDFSVVEQRTYNIHHPGKMKKTLRALNGILDDIEGLQEGWVMAVSIQNEFIYTPELDVTPLFDALEAAAGMQPGELLLRETKRNPYALVFAKGGGYDQVQGDMSGSVTVSVSASIVHAGYKVTAVSEVHAAHTRYAFVDLRVVDESVGFPVISLIEDVSTWRVGDEIVLTSTDYAWDHSEVRTIKAVIDSNTLQLSEELMYRHFGEIDQGVDMRAEVGLLTRNIRIEGKMKTSCPAENGNCGKKGVDHDTYGGHIKIYTSFGSVFIEGAMLYHMGQASDIGNYPVHFHMCMNITGKTAIVKRNAIRSTFLRATTIHGTWGTSLSQPGVQILENVAYDILGHAYFCEDGAEAGTIFIGNLGALIKRLDNGLSSDKTKPSVFWLTNPKVYMVNNVASGSYGNGIWYTFPTEPVGPSKGLLYQDREAAQTALWRCDNNVVHSNREGGFIFDNVLEEMGHVAGCMRYEAFINPLDPDSGPAKSQLARITVYKNSKVNLWLRGGWLELIQLSSAESGKGIQIARGSDQQMFVKKSIILGQTKNSETELGYPDAMTGPELKQYVGMVFHDGPTYLQDSWLDGFHSEDPNTYVAAAIGFVPENKRTTSVVANTTNLRFGFTDGEDGLRVFNGALDETVLGMGDTFTFAENAAFRDADGSVTKCPDDDTFQGPVQLISPTKYSLTDSCIYNEGWDMAVCTDLFGKLALVNKQTFTGTRFTFNNTGEMRRLRYDGAAGSTAYETHDMRKDTQYTVVLGSDEYYYEYQYLDTFPKEVQMVGTGVEKDGHVVVGICLPEGTTEADFNMYFKPNEHTKYNKLVYVDNLQEVLHDTTMTKVYWKGRMLYVKIWSEEVRNPDWSKQDSDHCPGKFCPRFRIEMPTNRPYTPCFSASKKQRSTEGFLDNVPRMTCQLPRSSGPEPDWGAGDYFASHDGNWGQWTAWTECCTDDTSGVTPANKSRFRLCDSPPKNRDGADCLGRSSSPVRRVHEVYP